ncbi:hypothetical protein WNY78_00935 [Psychroserpens sp. AS72]|uniref:hypothetical protein n=1 Tax=Psychroserpens sp. AS72 TaxID=3135775 RepID=UPI0031707F99
MINSLKRVFKKIKSEGLFSSTVDFYTLIYDKFYDKKYTIDTCTWVCKEDLDVDASAKEHASMYQATKVLHLRKLFTKLKPLTGKTIIDMGSGKARVLLVASEFGFKKAKGVEFSSNLCDISNRNIKMYNEHIKTNTVFEIINEDAGKYEFNDDEDIFYLYNPFHEVILSKVIENIKSSLHRNPRNILIIYKNANSKRPLIENNFQIKSTEFVQDLGGNFILYTI